MIISPQLICKPLSTSLMRIINSAYVCIRHKRCFFNKSLGYPSGPYYPDLHNFFRYFANDISVRLLCHLSLEIAPLYHEPFNNIGHGDGFAGCQLVIISARAVDLGYKFAYLVS